VRPLPGPYWQLRHLCQAAAGAGEEAHYPHEAGTERDGRRRGSRGIFAGSRAGHCTGRGAGHRHIGLAERHDHDQWETTPATPSKFGGAIKESAKDSKPWWPPRVVPPKGAPNVLLIMTDDQRYGISGTFGGVIPTPSLDRIANSGLRYTNFNSTILPNVNSAAIGALSRRAGPQKRDHGTYTARSRHGPDSRPIG